ncbi:ankyrin repeat domain-containing protein [Candidatus Dependentiae bacterium]|nr:ankyrin repeat domain-containing protein [Candidatus Dependentiae bacterium]
MFKKILFISLFAVMPLLAQQQNQSYWNRFAPTAAAFQKSFMRPFVGFKVAMNKYNPFRSLAFSMFVPVTMAESTTNCDTLKKMFEKDLANMKKVFGKPFDLYAYANCPELLAKAAHEGIDVNKTHFHRQTAMHEAVEKGNFQSVKVLIAHNGNVNARDGFGDTPLHKAARNNNFSMINYLVDNGAAIDARNEDNDRPIDIALMNHKLYATERLLERGARFDKVDLKKLSSTEQRSCDQQKALFTREKTDQIFTELEKVNKEIRELGGCTINSTDQKLAEGCETALRNHKKWKANADAYFRMQSTCETAQKWQALVDQYVTKKQ